MIKMACISMQVEVNANDMQVNALVRMHEAMQEKLKTASYSEPI